MATHYAVWPWNAGGGGGGGGGGGAVRVVRGDDAVRVVTAARPINGTHAWALLTLAPVLPGGWAATAGHTCHLGGAPTAAPLGLSDAFGSRLPSQSARPWLAAKGEGVRRLSGRGGTTRERRVHHG